MVLASGRTNPITNIGIGIATIYFATYLLKSGIRAIKNRKAMNNSPQPKISDIKEGMVRIKGKALSPKTHKSPLSNKECIFYRYKIFKTSSQYGWREIVDEKKGELCLKDDTGKINVNIKNSETVLETSYYFEGKYNKEYPDEVKLLLEKHNLKLKNIFGLKKIYRVHEYIIESNSEIHVIGKAYKTNNKISIKKGTSFFVTDNIERLKVILNNAKGLPYIITGSVFTLLGFILIVMTHFFFR